MSEIKSGLRSILSIPRIYDFWQALLGGKSARKQIIDDHVRPSKGMRLLDIGCGTAEILDLLPEHIDYIGFDASEEYIKHAKQRYGNRGHFYREHVSSAILEDIEKVDLVMASGILHHLQDEEVITLARLAHDALRPSGRFLTIDPALEYGQSAISRFLILRDRGQNVRPADGYRRLLEEKQPWNEIRVEVRHDLLFLPYTHAIIECRK
ncbi:MAG: class I SAM-dependent methyltransferase [Gammaproteobacteria bacterium]|nr:class I SAM-dependent methyltransferase [Gammaproteobacteria bacterium]